MQVILQATSHANSPKKWMYTEARTTLVAPRSCLSVALHWLPPPVKHMTCHYCTEQSLYIVTTLKFLMLVNVTLADVSVVTAKV